MTGPILVVEDNAITRKMVRIALEARGFDVVEAGNGAEAVASAKHRAPILILQDLFLPDIDGLVLVGLLRAIPSVADIPILAFSGLLSKLEEARSLKAAFTDYIFKPIEPARLWETIDRVLTPSSVQVNAFGNNRRLLLVDDDDVQRKLNRIQLQHAGFRVTGAGSGAEALTVAAAELPDVVVTDLMMPGMTGIELCMAIRRDPTVAAIPVIIASSTFSNIDAEDRAFARKVGASAFVVRTSGLRDVLQALELTCADGRAQPLAADADNAHEAYARRLMRQLEHQSMLNSSLMHRAAMDAALLSISSAVGQVIAKKTDLNTTLTDVLSRALDASGVSAGAIFLRSAGGRLKVHAEIGHSVAEREQLPDFFGYPVLLSAMVGSEAATVIPSIGIDPAVSAPLLAAASATALVVAPLAAGGVTHGALVMRMSRPDPSDGWVTSISTVATQLAQAVALARSMDELMASQTELTERNERFLQLSENISEVFFVMDAQYRETLYINPAYEKIWGLSRQSLYDDPTSFLGGYAPADQPAVIEYISRVQKGEDAGEIEARIVRPDGEIRWVLTHAIPIRNAEGKVYRISGTALDITDRKLAHSQLEEASARFRRLAEASFDAVVISKKGVIVDVNAAFGRMFGLDNEHEALGRHAIEFIAEESVDEVRRRIEYDVEGDYEIVGKRKDGKKLLIEVQARTTTVDGSPARVTALRDVTEQRSLAAQFQQAQKMEAVGRLAGGVAHDFNNLLTVITGHSEMLSMEMGAGDPRNESLGQIRTAAHAAAGLTRQLLAFSRQQVIEPRTVELEEVVERTRKMLGHVIGEDIDFALQLSPELSLIHIDPGQLEQVIMNLAVNARDAMPLGGKLTIETGTVDLDEEGVRTHQPAAPGRYALLAVSDNGVGMDLATQQRAFEPFFTTKEPGKGTGLGLATAYGIIQQSGGFISVYSEPRVGTTFKIYLPLAQGKAVPELDMRDLQPLPSGSETVLLVEDAPAVRDVTRRALQRQGYIVLESASAIDALVMAQRPDVRIALLLTDVVMPQMSGRVLAERFALLHPSAKVLFMSGYTDDAVVRHGVLSAEMPYLQKPFTPHMLATKVRLVLDAN